MGQLGWDAKATIPGLVNAVREDAETQVRHQAVTTLDQIVRGSDQQLQGWQVGEINQLKDFKEKLLDSLKKELAKDKTNWSTKAQDLNTLQLLSRFLDIRLSQLTEQPIYQVVAWGQGKLWIIVIGVGAIAVATAYGTIFWLRPLWLLKLGDEVIQAIANTPHVGAAFSGVLKALLPLKYHLRVLNAWVEQHWQQSEEAFLKLDAVRARQIHISLPVRLGQDQILISQLSGSDLTTIFQKRPTVLLIVGEGGAGKTSWACQIAQWGLHKQLASHRLLPILIETELDDKKTLIETIRGQLNALINGQDDISIDLVEKLLKRQRILVIVDHLSEMSEATRKQVTPELATFPAKALVITSRLEETLGGASNKTILKPQRIEANRLLGFMQEYVRWYMRSKLNKQDDPFLDDEYVAACDRLRRMVGQRNITVLLARLYAEQMIEQQEGAGGMLPASVPELMLSYLNQLNSKIEPDNQRDHLQVQREAQVIAWECLKQTYRPTAALREIVIQALRDIQPASSEDPRAQDSALSTNLEYLEKRLQLLQTLEPRDKIRFVLDPLAEYLAANFLVDRSRAQENPEAFWQQFLESIDSVLEQNNDPHAAIQGFLLAVRDCCLVKQKEARISSGVPEELARRAGLDPEKLRQDEEKRRIRLLISELSAPELEFRIEAAEKLGKRGSAARGAERNLTGMMENPNQEIEARQAAAQALGNLGIGIKELLTLLTDDTDEPAVRRSAAESLGLMKVGCVELIKILECNDQPLLVRQGAARALSLIGTVSGEAIPMLIVELEDGEVITHVEPIPVWKEPLGEELTLNLVAIPGGKFLMGSPTEELERDWYADSYPDTQGLDVETQHLVTVAPFHLSQYPITQAQWRFVSTLPKVERNLDPDPASFKGNNRPIDTVSWYEAVEFCARLSQYTSKTYRLPSEAEWEYACRGGTTTPFHFGATLSTEIANYNGNYTYGNSIKGGYRQKTTEVGSFGFVNRLGLGDLHGNIWEWCLDYWHPSYQGAPVDGSAWITAGDERYRLLRGGAWDYIPANCRSAFRCRHPPTIRAYSFGFRVVLHSA